MELIEVYSVTVSDYSKLKRTWAEQTDYFSTDEAATDYFSTVQPTEFRRKHLKKIHLLKANGAYFPLPEPVLLR